MSAADRLRQAISALPESERGERWPVIQPDAYPSVSLDPAATLALANLLDASHALGARATDEFRYALASVDWLIERCQP